LGKAFIVIDGWVFGEPAVKVPPALGTHETAVVHLAMIGESEPPFAD